MLSKHTPVVYLLLKQFSSKLKRRRERKQDYGYLFFQHHVFLGLKEVNHAIIDELSTRGLTILSSFPALPSILARLVFVALSKLCFVLVFHLLCWMQNTYGVKRPICCAPRACADVSLLGSCLCFTYVLGQCHSLVKAAEKAFGTLPVPLNLAQGSPKAGLNQFGGARS